MRDVPPPPVREVPPPPPAPAVAKDDAKHEEDEEDEEDGGEKWVLVAPAPTPLESLREMCAGCVSVEPLGAPADGGAATMALVEYAAERDAIAAVASLAALGHEAEIARRTLWRDDEDDADVTSTVVRVEGVSATINESIVARVFGTYGACVAATREEGTDAFAVKMADRRGAETAAAALSGVYRFEEGQEFPVRVTWCPCPSKKNSGDKSSAAGEKRKRDAGEEAGAGEGATLSAKQLLAVGLPATTTGGEQVAGWFAAEGGACLLFDKDRRCAILAFPSADAATEALDTHGGTLRPEGNPCPVTLRRIACDVTARPKKRSAVQGPPPGVWPPVPKPGPEYGEPSAKIYIGSIPQEYAEDDVRRIFETVGEVKEVKILRNPGDGRHKGSGFVTFSDIAATERAIHFIDNKYTLNAPSYPQQKPIYMKYAKLSRSAAAPQQPMVYQQPMGYHQPYYPPQQAYGHYPQQAYAQYPQQAYGQYPQQGQAPQGPTHQQQQMWQQGFGGGAQQ